MRRGDVFDPLGPLERWISGRILHALVRVFAVVFFLIVLSWRAGFYEFCASKPRWWAQTAVVAAWAWAYAIRVSPVRRAKGVREILIPFVAILLSTFVFHARGVAALAPGVCPASSWGSWIFVFGTALAAAGVVSLGRSFSITPEVRRLSTGGLYRFVRHPIYLGESIACLGVALGCCSVLGIALWFCFVALQIWRAKMEESKLEALPGYAAYRARTGFFCPDYQRCFTS